MVGVSQFLYIKVSIHFTDAQNKGESWSVEVREEKRGDASLGRKPFFFFFSSMIIPNYFKQQITYTASVNLLPTDFSDLHTRFMSYC